MLERDAAKYPFLKEAAKLVDALNIQLNDLADPVYSKVLNRATERVTEAILEGVVESKLDDYMTELLSYPVASMLVSVKGESFLDRRYALAEAVRIYFLLMKEDTKTLFEIAINEFNWDLKEAKENFDGQSYTFKLFFSNYLHSSNSFHEDKWKLVNRVLKNGYVLLQQNEVARLIQGEVEMLIKERVSIRPKFDLPEPIKQKLDEITKVFEENRRKIGAEDLPTEVIREAFPPCIRYCMEGLLSGRRASHMERFALTSFLINIGMPTESIVDLYVSVTDFDESLTRYQIEHIAGLKGNKTRYTPPLCDTLRTHGICRNKDNICERIKHPLSYYRRKARLI
ncbi:DNA primase regulatory subunit PriL, partial [Candidatus Bathyarchaeota archaeon]|nr:DNA primase regulatory subunit PriL [Candidatus Bathyarchaeota archaeon]